MKQKTAEEEFAQEFYEQWQKVRDEIWMLHQLMQNAEILYGIGGKPQPPFRGKSIAEMVGKGRP